jgi:hypothetical protein
VVAIPDLAFDGRQLLDPNSQVGWQQQRSAAAFDSAQGARPYRRVQRRPAGACDSTGFGNSVDELIFHVFLAALAGCVPATAPMFAIG